MASRFSRAQFLRVALDCYETGDSQRLFDLANDLWVDTMAEEVEQLSDDDNRILNEMDAEIRKAKGEQLNNQRLSVTPHPQPDIAKVFFDHMGRLSVKGQEIMLPAYQRALDVRREQPSPAAAEDSEQEALAARYTREVIDLLPSVIGKAKSLQELQIDRIPRPSVQRYFDEAHRCYFFGLKRACVVLCRAILEAALKEVIGPKNTIENLLELAAQPRPNGKPLLDGERLDAAERIFSAGNCAVHQEHIFDRSYKDADIERFLLNMRKILEDLYSQSATASA